MKQIGSTFLMLLILIFLSCNEDESDPCALIDCVNNSICVEGKCQCTEQYAGAACEDQVTPAAIEIINIQVRKFPSVDKDGDPWDPTSGPDLYVTMTHQDEEVYSHPTYFEDASANVVHVFSPIETLRFEKPLGMYSIKLFDFDAMFLDEEMASIIFQPYNETNQFPSTLVYESQPVNFEIKITVKYIY